MDINQFPCLFLLSMYAKTVSYSVLWWGRKWQISEQAAVECPRKIGCGRNKRALIRCWGLNGIHTDRILSEKGFCGPARQWEVTGSCSFWSLVKLLLEWDFIILVSVWSSLISIMYFTSTRSYIYLFMHYLCSNSYI